jgi:uracil-DNA glycosylase family 4
LAKWPGQTPSTCDSVAYTGWGGNGATVLSENRERLRRVVTGRLESLQRAGVQQLPKARERVVAASAAVAVPAVVDASPVVSPIAAEPVQVVPPVLTPVEAAPVAAAPSLITEEEAMPRKSSTTVSAAAPAVKSAWSRGGGAMFEEAADAKWPPSTAATLAILQKEVAPCTRCGELAATRTQTVFGVGNPKTRLCFLGEAPGADEDRLGEPFVGRGGQLLNKIIEACKLKREDIYILNMLKCRPPGNRNPSPEELVNCRPYLERQLELLAPEYICCLGAVASQNLLGTTTAIGKLRGKFHQYRGAKVVCTFHPAYLLRNPAAKKDCWDDMKFLMRDLGVEL